MNGQLDTKSVGIYVGMLLKKVKTDYPPFYPVGTQKMKRAAEAECRGWWPRPTVYLTWKRAYAFIRQVMVEACFHSTAGNTEKSDQLRSGNNLSNGQENWNWSTV